MGPYMWGDIYMVLDDGMTGNRSVFMKPFQGKDKCTTMFHIYNDQDSVEARHERVRDIGNIHQTESLTCHFGDSNTIGPPTQ